MRKKQQRQTTTEFFKTEKEMRKIRKNSWRLFWVAITLTVGFIGYAYIQIALH